VDVDHVGDAVRVERHSERDEAARAELAVVVRAVVVEVDEARHVDRPHRVLVHNRRRPTGRGIFVLVR